MRPKSTLALGLAGLAELLKEIGLQVFEVRLGVPNVFSEFRKWDVAADFCQGWLQAGEGCSIDLGDYLRATLIWSDEEEWDVEVWLHGEQVGHAKQPRIDRGRALDFKGCLGTSSP
jgi:hypothetical protein